MNAQGKPYGQRVKEALAEGARAGAELRKMRASVGSRGHFGVVGKMPKILHQQLMDRFGPSCFSDESFIRDLKRNHPEMMNASGEDVSGDNILGTKNRFGGVSYKRMADGTWWHWTGTDWEKKAPPSKMAWGKDPAPALM